MEENSEVRKKRQIKQDRIVLEPSSLEVVVRLQAQVEAQFSGMIKLSNKEVANFLLQSRADHLSSAELENVHDRFFDEVKAAKWAVERLRVARNTGESLKLADVFAMLQTPHVKKKRRSRKLATPVGEQTGDGVASEQVMTVRAKSRAPIEP